MIDDAAGDGKQGAAAENENMTSLANGAKQGSDAPGHASGDGDVKMDDGNVDMNREHGGGREADAGSAPDHLVAPAKHFIVDEQMLARKLGQIIGFHFDASEFSEVNSDQQRAFNPQLVVNMMKEAGMDEHLVQEAEQAIEKSKHVNDEQGLLDFLRRDVSLIQDNKGFGTIYAVDIDNAPEMNLVERVFRSRDILLEKGQLSIILPEEELKKHLRDPNLNRNEMAMFGSNRCDAAGSTYGNDISRMQADRRDGKTSSP